MSTIEEVQATVVELRDVITEVDTKLDEVKARIDVLVAGSVTQEQIDALKVSVDATKEAASKVLSEATDLA